LDTKVNHAVVVVGYGHDEKNGKDFWLIKNSFGTTWGDEGYFKLLRTNEDGPGFIGI
jgi:C1A family cysteine protease